MWTIVALFACKPGVSELPDPSTGPAETSTDDPVQDVADAFYAIDHLVRIDLEIAPDDAAALAAQTNALTDLLVGEDCLDEPWNGPFTWFPADVVIDGTRIDQIGIRKKGLIGSLSTEKPSLKLRFDEYVDGQEYDGLEHLTLNNSISDPALVRQCLGYWLVAAAGLPAPRCNFADVTANGDALGIYVNVEPPKRMMLRNVFGEDDGDLYEGTLSDFRDG